ncbi:BgTH12-01181 [Blumeria graminis f. sp. triticale]|uniref:BgTH12-01181 n=1 Tax=Blumeria graminis f. sp. triticale TaxID=1689686 RepID=A0A9W4DSB6_BLUGR|nr:BgTH12-01181 [Blumeria graminis f. sp. triticale]
MAEDLTAPSLNLSPEEFRLFGHLFRQADVEGIGVVTGEVAVKFFEKTRLEPRILGEIWQIADKENRGLLTPEGFGIVLRLIGHYQAGRDPTPELALQPGPLPKFVNSSSNLGLSPSKNTAPVSPSSTLHPQASGSGLIRVPPLAPDKAAQYAALFEKSGAQNGVLPGEQAKQIFERASLPNEVLGKIWSLADSEQKGALQVTEFVIAMHLLASCKTGNLRSLPSALPYGLYEDAAQGIFGRSISNATGISNVPRQSGTRPGQTPSKLDIRSIETSPRIPTQNTGSSNDWIISLSDQAKFNAIYNTLDKSNRGFITGEEAVPFFSESKLPEEALAQIWDLADVNSAGRLSRDEFAIAMYLIRQQRGRRDGRSSLPSSLPSNLIPPSMRNQVRPVAVPSAPDFDGPATTLPKSAAEDLFGLDALSTPIIASNQPSQLTGGSKSLASAYPSDIPNTTLPSTLNSPSKQPTVQRFVPTSSFGQSLTQQITGGRNNHAQTIGSHPAASTPTAEDLLGDNDPEISKQLTSDTAEVANLTNQIGSLSKQVQDLQCCKITHQEELSQTTTQKLELETRLSQLRTQYEQELRDVRDLESRLGSSQSERQNLLNEVETLQNKLQDLHNEHTKLLNSIRAEQQEEMNLKERMRTVLAEIVQIKPILEKERLESRRQKGLLAINKKQLALDEAERDRIKSEIGEITKKKREGTEPTSPSSWIQSAGQSTMNANNPFFRRKESSCETSPSSFAIASGSAQNVEKNLQNVFGAAFGSAAVPTEVPPPLTMKSTTRTSSFCSVPPALNQPYSTELSGPRKLPTTFNSELTWKSQNPSELPLSGVNQESIQDSNLVNDISKSLTNTHNETLPCEMSSGKDIASTIPMQATGNRESNLNSQSILNTFQETETVKSDFDTAFAGLQSINKPQERTSRRSSSRSGSVRNINTSAFLKEFPPISKLENEDGESDSESEGVGFDDDFAPPSPGHLKKANILSEELDVRENESSSTSRLKLSHQSPDRSSNSTSSSLETKTHQATVDNIVSASDQIDSKYPPNPNQSSSCNVATSSPIPLESITASSTTDTIPSAPVTKTTSKPPTPPKIPLENDIDEFDDLEDAKEGDANDDFVRITTANQPIIDDFNPLFDNSTQSARIQTPSQGLKESPPAPLMPTQGKTTSSVVNSKDDWDAIFAGFDPSQAKAGLHNRNEVLGSPDSLTTIPLRIEEEKGLHTSGHHDDPILKNLTGMGYSRAEALKALEKYDYDLERAADYLASQS